MLGNQKKKLIQEIEKREPLLSRLSSDIEFVKERKKVVSDELEELEGTFLARQVDEEHLRRRRTIEHERIWEVEHKKRLTDLANRESAVESAEARLVISRKVLAEVKSEVELAKHVLDEATLSFNKREERFIEEAEKQKASLEARSTIINNRARDNQRLETDLLRRKDSLEEKEALSAKREDYTRLTMDKVALQSKKLDDLIATYDKKMAGLKQKEMGLVRREIQLADKESVYNTHAKL